MAYVKGGESTRRYSSIQKLLSLSSEKTLMMLVTRSSSMLAMLLLLLIGAVCIASGGLFGISSFNGGLDASCILSFPFGKDDAATHTCSVFTGDLHNQLMMTTNSSRWSLFAEAAPAAAAVGDSDHHEDDREKPAANARSIDERTVPAHDEQEANNGNSNNNNNDADKSAAATIHSNLITKKQQPQKRPLAAAGGGPPPNARPTRAAFSSSYQLQPLQPRLVAIGDVHGDLVNFKSILQHAQLIDCNGKWIGEDARVIQLGDICDRGPHSHTIIEYIDDVLIPQARAAGGEFLQLLGNHELLTMRGDARFVSKEHIDKAFGGSVEEWAHHFSTKGVYGKRNSRLDTIVVRNGTAFVHAGLLPEHAEKGVEWVNAEMRAMMENNNWDHVFSHINSPVWTREQVYAAMRRGDCRLLRESLKRLSSSEVARGRTPVNRLVVGHTIQPSGAVSVFCDGQFIAADVASSQYMQGGGHLAFVEFRRRALVRTNVIDGSVSVAERFASEFEILGALSHLVTGNKTSNGKQRQQQKGEEAAGVAGAEKNEQETPLSETDLQYLLLLNEGSAVVGQRRRSDGSLFNAPQPLEIVGVPFYPPIPWKRHKGHAIQPPRWAVGNTSTKPRQQRGVDGPSSVVEGDEKDKMVPLGNREGGNERDEQLRLLDEAQPLAQQDHRTNSYRLVALTILLIFGIVVAFMLSVRGRRRNKKHFFNSANTTSSLTVETPKTGQSTINTFGGGGGATTASATSGVKNFFSYLLSGGKSHHLNNKRYRDTV